MKKSIITTAILAATFTFSPAVSSDPLGDALISSMNDSFLSMGLSGEGAAYCSQYVTQHPKSNKTLNLIVPALKGNLKAQQELNKRDCDGGDIGDDVSSEEKVVTKHNKIQFYGADFGSGIIGYITNAPCDIPELAAKGYSGKFISTIPTERLKTSSDYYFITENGERAVTVKGCFFHTDDYNIIQTYSVRKRDGKVFTDTYDVSNPMWRKIN